MGCSSWYYSIQMPALPCLFLLSSWHHFLWSSSLQTETRSFTPFYSFFPFPHQNPDSSAPENNPSVTPPLSFIAILIQQSWLCFAYCCSLMIDLLCVLLRPHRPPSEQQRDTLRCTSDHLPSIISEDLWCSSQCLGTVILYHPPQTHPSVCSFVSVFIKHTKNTLPTGLCACFFLLAYLAPNHYRNYLILMTWCCCLDLNCTPKT